VCSSDLPLDILPLRERRGDIELLAVYFLKQIAETYAVEPRELDPQLLEALCQYPWPGNVRELRAVLENMLVMSDSKVLRYDALPADIASSLVGGSSVANPSLGERGKSSLNKPLPAAETLDGLECEAIRNELILHKGNRSKVARILGISRSTLYRKIKNYGLAGD
jgi:DNA-binding NtrC family response regulator